MGSVCVCVCVCARAHVFSSGRSLLSDLKVILAMMRLVIHTDIVVLTNAIVHYTNSFPFRRIE